MYASDVRSRPWPRLSGGRVGQVKVVSQLGRGTGRDSVGLTKSDYVNAVGLACHSRLVKYKDGKLHWPDLVPKFRLFPSGRSLRKNRHFPTATSRFQCRVGYFHDTKHPHQLLLNLDETTECHGHQKVCSVSCPSNCIWNVSRTHGAESWCVA